MPIEQTAHDAAKLEGRTEVLAEIAEVTLRLVFAYPEASFALKDLSDWLEAQGYRTQGELDRLRQEVPQ